MDLDLIVNEIASERLTPLGFRFDAKPDSDAWRFARFHQMTIQYITVVHSLRRQNSLKVQVSTSTNQLGVETWQFLPGGEKLRWVTYGDEASLRAAVEMLLDESIEHGLRWFGGGA